MHQHFSDSAPRFLHLSHTSAVRLHWAPVTGSWPRTSESGALCALSLLSVHPIYHQTPHSASHHLSVRSETPPVPTSLENHSVTSSALIPPHRYDSPSLKQPHVSTNLTGSETRLMVLSHRSRLLIPQPKVAEVALQMQLPTAISPRSARALCFRTTLPRKPSRNL